MISLTKKHRFLLSLLSGVMIAISFPYTGSLTPFIFISWLPLLFVESFISSKNYKSTKVFIHAYLTFFIYNITATWWIWNADPGGASLAIILNSLLMAISFHAFHLTKKSLGEREGYISLLFLWIGFEYFHYHWEMSWTWLSLGNVFSITPSWVQWYSYVGVLGGTLWVLVVNLLFFRCIQNVYLKNESWRIQTPIIWSGSLLVVIPIIFSLYSYYTYEERGEAIEVVAIQPNIDPYNSKFDPESLQGQIKTFVRLADSLSTENTKLIVAPETALGIPFSESDIQSLDFFKYLIREKNISGAGVPWYIGASTFQLFNKKQSRASRSMSDGSFLECYNSSLLITENDDTEFVHKSKLVPGAEVVPFSDIFPFLETLSIDNGGTTGTLGIEESPQIFEMDQLNIAPVICYESIYGGWVAEQCKKGADLITIITNDGWWGDTPGYKQHMSFASLRAIENRKSVVRSANTGITCFVNQRGDILNPTKWWEEDVIKANVCLNNEDTFYTVYGDVIGRSFSFAAVLILLFAFVKGFKKKYVR